MLARVLAGFVVLLCLVLSACTAEAASLDDADPEPTATVQMSDEVVAMSIHMLTRQFVALRDRLEAHIRNHPSTDHYHGPDRIGEPGYHNHRDYAYKDHSHGWDYADKDHDHW